MVKQSNKSITTNKGKTLSIFTRKTPAAQSVVTTLAQKGSQKAAESERKNQLADTLLNRAADARSASQVDADHAEAISKAVAILDEAGVSI